MNKKVILFLVFTFGLGVNLNLVAMSDDKTESAENQKNLQKLINGCRKNLSEFSDDSIWGEFEKNDKYDYTTICICNKTLFPYNKWNTFNENLCCVLGAMVRKGIIYDETELITALLRAVAVMAKQHSKRNGKESKIKNVFADVTRIANELAVWYNFNKKGHVPKNFSLMSAVWLLHDFCSLTQHLRGEKKNEDEELNSTPLTEEQKKFEQKISDFNKKLVTYILPAIESLTVILRAYDSLCATRYSKNKIYEYASKQFNVNLTLFCSVILAASRISLELEESKSGSLEQRWALVKIIIGVALLINDPKAKVKMAVAVLRRSGQHVLVAV